MVYMPRNGAWLAPCLPRDHNIVLSLGHEIDTTGDNSQLSHFVVYVLSKTAADALNLKFWGHSLGSEQSCLYEEGNLLALRYMPLRM